MLGRRLILRSPHLRWLLTRVVPRLRSWPPEAWPAVLGKARTVDHDALERVGLLAGLALVTWLLRPPAGADAGPLAVFLSQLLQAVPLLLVVLGPLHLRRLRRGVQTLHRQEHPANRPTGER